jgi:hypothetical protein
MISNKKVFFFCLAGLGIRPGTAQREDQLPPPNCGDRPRKLPPVIAHCHDPAVAQEGITSALALHGLVGLCHTKIASFPITERQPGFCAYILLLIIFVHSLLKH